MDENERMYTTGEYEVPQQDRDQKERELIEDLVEQFYENDRVNTYVNETIMSYNLDFDPRGAMTEAQMELYCQYQNLVYTQLVSGMLRVITGRGHTFTVFVQ